MNERKEEKRGFVDANALFGEESPAVEEFYAARMGGITDSVKQSMWNTSSRRTRPVPGSSHLLPDVEPLSADPSSGTRNARPQTPKP